MRLAILSDIHANLEALHACLEHAGRERAGEFVFPGDLVGYGADPVPCLETVQAYAARGALVLRGNHDEAARGGSVEGMNDVAREAILWTRRRLDDAQCAFLAGLPFVARRDGVCFAHATPAAPERWGYIMSGRDAVRAIAAADAPITVVGHVHHQTLYFAASNGGAGAFRPTAGRSIVLAARRRWLAVCGSVGQPRDGNRAAAYAVLDLERRTLTFHRVPYDYREAARKIRAAGLPERLALRLETGR